MFGVLSSNSDRKTPNVAGRQKGAERWRRAEATDRYLRPGDTPYDGWYDLDPDRLRLLRRPP